MTVLAAVSGGSILLVLLLLACPLGMMFMMRGHGHGHGNAGDHETARGQDGHCTQIKHATLDDLRRQRADIDAEIAKLEQADQKEAVTARR